MHAELREPDITIDDAPGLYRVRIWTAPRSARLSWMVDDWELAAEDVEGALAWAHQEAAGRPFELLVRAAGGSNYLRLLGEPADNVSVSEVVPLVR
ncbi:hypothetical protein GCM10009739_22460 [Microbacterium ulmi]